MGEHRILIGSDGPKDNILKIRPPLTFESDNAEMIAVVLGRVLAEVKNARSQQEAWGIFLCAQALLGTRASVMPCIGRIDAKRAHKNQAYCPSQIQIEPALGNEL